MFRFRLLILLCIAQLGLAAACAPAPGAAKNSVTVSRAMATTSRAEIMATAVTPTGDVTGIVTRTATPPASLNATAEPSPVPSPTLPFDGARLYPPDTRTGIETIDRVIEVALNGSDEELRSIIFGFTTVGCTHKLGLGGPPKCREGESEGTLVEVKFHPGIEGGYTRKDNIMTHFGMESAGLVAAYRVLGDISAAKSDNDGYDIIFFSSPRYGLVLKADQRGIIDFFTIEDGDYILDDSIPARLDIVKWEYLYRLDYAAASDYIAANTLAGQLERGSAEIILPPLRKN